MALTTNSAGELRAIATMGQRRYTQSMQVQPGVSRESRAMLRLKNVWGFETAWEVFRAGSICLPMDAACRAPGRLLVRGAAPRSQFKLATRLRRFLMCSQTCVLSLP